MEGGGRGGRGGRGGGADGLIDGDGWTDIPYSGYFSGGKIFAVFVVERRTMKFSPMKQYRIVPGCGLVYCDHKIFSTNWPKMHCSRKFNPPKNTRYAVHDKERRGKVVRERETEG